MEPGLLPVVRKRAADGGITPGQRKIAGRSRVRAWQDRIRNPSLSILLGLEVFGIFVAVPLAARGWPMARWIADTVLLAFLAIVVTLSHHRGAMVVILLGFAAVVADLVAGAGWSETATTLIRRGGDIVLFSALAWVVGHAVYAPGRITSQRLQGAVVVYLTVALIFASAYCLIWELRPDAFRNLAPSADVQTETAALLYFSLATLTTTGYGDIVAVDPFARSLANLESVLGVFYLAITVARLVTLELADRRR
jgi:hypothetical protein